ncbi:MAG: nuclear transport factor 2 family protein [Candidatus Pelagadaptatus aseana]|uniref:nuclear transport factor 2 family protein n=1 Tax=Candidatus Pelagadaptatus aseana TaxID=3120508 RepID=UPI0039B27592
MDTPTFLEQWHKVVFERDMETLSELLADDVEFHSPTLWKPKQGKEIAHYILQMIIQIFEDFEYHREFQDGDSVALEFSAKVEGNNLKGIDLIRLNDEGKIVHFEVLIRPLNTLQLIFEKMTAELQKAGFLPKS